MEDDICWGVYSLLFIWYLKLVPIFLFAAIIVPFGLEIAWRRAGSPTNICPSFVNATTDGKAFPATVAPSADGIIVGLAPSSTAAAELDVPKSIPIILLILLSLYVNLLINCCVI